MKVTETFDEVLVVLADDKNDCFYEIEYMFFHPHDEMLAHYKITPKIGCSCKPIKSEVYKAGRLTWVDFYDNF